MDQGEAPNGNIPFAAGGRAANVHLTPQYVLCITIRSGSIERVLPEIRVPRHLTAVRADLFLEILEHSLTNLTSFPLTPGPEYNPLLELLDQNADYWTIDVNSAGDSLTVSFYAVRDTISQEVERPAEGPLQAPGDQPSAASNPPPDSGSEMPSAERSSGSDQPTTSRQLNNSEVGSNRSRTTREDIKRKRKANDSLESTEPKRRRSEVSDSDSLNGSSNPMISSPASSKETSFDEEQPGYYWLHNCAASTQSSRGQTDVRRGVKRKTTSSSSFDGEEAKKRRADDLFDLDSAGCSSSSTFSPTPSPGDDEQPGSSHQESTSGVRESDDQENQEEFRRRGKRTRKTSGRSESRKRKRSNQDSDSD